MKKRSASRLDEILSRMTKTTSMGKSLELARIWEHWSEVVGPRLANHGHPHSVKDKTLYIEAESPVWMNHFAYSKWHIVKRINRMARHELISDLFIALEPERPDADQES